MVWWNRLGKKKEEQKPIQEEVTPSLEVPFLDITISLNFFDPNGDVWGLINNDHQMDRYFFSTVSDSINGLVSDAYSGKVGSRGFDNRNGQTDHFIIFRGPDAVTGEADKEKILESIAGIIKKQEGALKAQEITTVAELVEQKQMMDQIEGASGKGEHAKKVGQERDRTLQKVAERIKAGCEQKGMPGPYIKVLDEVLQDLIKGINRGRGGLGGGV